jgi:hypothetical protein
MSIDSWFAHFIRSFRDLNQYVFVQFCAIHGHRLCAAWVNEQCRACSNCHADSVGYEFNGFLAHTVSRVLRFSELPFEIVEP